MSTTVKNSKMARRYGEEFKRQAVELLIHSGKPWMPFERLNQARNVIQLCPPIR